MAAKLVLLAHAALVAITTGPFPDANAPATLMTGMTLVSAMALQNALHRTHLKDLPPSTMVTGTVTQILPPDPGGCHGPVAAPCGNGSRRHP